MTNLSAQGGQVRTAATSEIWRRVYVEISEVAGLMDDELERAGWQVRTAATSEIFALWLQIKPTLRSHILLHPLRLLERSIRRRHLHLHAAQRKAGWS